MNIVIIGEGKVGYALAEHLSQEGHDVTAIDNRSKTLEDSVNALDVNGLEGNGVSFSVQMEAGVQQADLMIAVTGSDEINMICCLVAKKLGARHTIARVRNFEYQEQMLFLKDELGLSMVINPEQAAAAEIARILRFPSAIKVETFAKGRMELAEFKIREDSPLSDLALSELGRKFGVKVLVCAVERGEAVHIPKGDFVLHAGDKISVAASPADIEKFFKAMGIFKRHVRSVMILGGGRLGFYLAKQLLEIGIRVKIIELDKDRCDSLSELLPKAMIIHGDGADQELLHEEGIADTDAFVALTGIDEENIILSMYANTCKVDKVITKVGRTNFVDMLSNSGLECFICPKAITSLQILQYVRAMQNSHGNSSVETLYRLVGERVEALEFRVRAGCRCAGIPLKDLALKNSVLIAGVIRKGRCIIPGGNDVIQVDDSVIVITVDKGLNELESILAE